MTVIGRRSADCSRPLSATAFGRETAASANGFALANAAIASSSLSRSPRAETPISLRPASVSRGSRSASILLSRKLASYWPSSRLRSQDPTSMVLHPVLETMIVEIGKGVQQGCLPLHPHRVVSWQFLVCLSESTRAETSMQSSRSSSALLRTIGVSWSGRSRGIRVRSCRSRCETGRGWRPGLWFPNTDCTCRAIPKLRFWAGRQSFLTTTRRRTTRSRTSPGGKSGGRGCSQSGR